MFEVKITIEAPGLTEAITQVAKAISTTAQTQTKAIKGDVVHIAPTKETQKPVQEAPAPQPVKQAPQPVQQPEPVKEALAPAQTQPVQEAPAISLDTLSRAGAALIDAGMLPQVMQTIQKYGVQTITQLKPDVYPALAADLRALGAKI